MGPLLDPKLYPVRVAASPETPTSRYDQPNAFLDKVCALFLQVVRRQHNLIIVTYRSVFLTARNELFRKPDVNRILRF